MTNVQMPFERPWRPRREDLGQGKVSLRGDPAGRVVVDLVDQLETGQTSRTVLVECPVAQYVERSGGDVAASGVCSRPIADLSHGLTATLVKGEYDVCSRHADLETTRVDLLYRVTDPAPALAAVMLRGDPLPDLLGVPGGKAGPPT